VKVSDVVVPPSVLELVPESVARENVILPLAEEDGALRVIICDPNDIDTFEKLRFILNRRIEPVLAPRDAILEAINRHYGQKFAESADSMLTEFTDTAIDFTAGRPAYFA
jgi:type IV pilus assembly protein PilB